MECTECTEWRASNYRAYQTILTTDYTDTSRIKSEVGGQRSEVGGGGFQLRVFNRRTGHDEACPSRWNLTADLRPLVPQSGIHLCNLWLKMNWRLECGGSFQLADFG